MAKKKVVKGKVSDESRMQAFVATFLSIVGFILALILWKKDKYVMHYATQSFIIFIIAIVLGVPRMLFGWIPVLGGLIEFAIGLIILLAWIFSWVNALSYKKKKIPVVSDFAKYFKF